MLMQLLEELAKKFKTESVDYKLKVKASYQGNKYKRSEAVRGMLMHDWTALKKHRS